MKKLLGVAILSMGLLTPTVAIVQAQDHRHEWNDGERDAWQRYLKERHRKDHDWAHASKREQADYWKWRDAHR